MDKQRIIFIQGSNAIGKSTRVSHLVDSLGDTWEDHHYTFNKVSKKEPTPKTTTILAGRQYPCGTYIVGRPTLSGVWVGTDYAFSQLGGGYSILKYLDTVVRAGAQTVIVEGFYGVGNLLGPASLGQLYGTDLNKEYYFFIYDDIEQFIERTEGRSGKTWPRTRVKTGAIIEAENSAGWNGNSICIKREQEWREGLNEGDKVVKLGWEAPVDILSKEILSNCPK